MVYELDLFLKKIANREELQGNKLAWTVAKYPHINKSDKKSFYESLVAFYPVEQQEGFEKFEIKAEEGYAGNHQEKDLRIKSLKLANVRGIPALRDGLPYGIQFTEDDKIKHAILLGANGTGKSSVYGALEFLYCNEIGEAKLRTPVSNPDLNLFKSYLTRFNCLFHETHCEVNTAGGSYDIHTHPLCQGDFEKLNPHTHFLSDFDIYEKGRLNYDDSQSKSFHYLIAESLGLKNLLAFHALMNEFKSYKRYTESRALTALSKEEKEIEKNLQQWNEEILYKTEQIKRLEESDKKLSGSLDYSAQFVFLSEVKSKVFVALPAEDKILELIDGFNGLYAKWKDMYKLAEGEMDVVEFLSLGRDLMERSEDCPFCRHSSLNKAEILEGVSQRLETIKEFVEIRKVIANQVDKIVNVVSAIYHWCLDNVNKLYTEQYGQFDEFRELEIINESFFQYLKEVTNSEAVEELVSLDKKNFKNDDLLYAYLYDFFRDHTLELERILNGALSFFNEYAERRKVELEKIETVLRKKSEENRPVEQIAILKKEMEDLKNAREQRSRRLESVKKEIAKVAGQIQIYKEIKQDTEVYVKIIDREIDQIVNQGFEPIKDIVTLILEEYMQKDVVSLKIEKTPDQRDPDTGEIFSEFISIKLRGKEDDSIELTPNKYFNTFRYRLFSMMVGISIAIASRNQSNVNIPLVLDDVFYASDFEKRATIVKFIRQLFQIFKIHARGPVQLILFTHDELMFDSIRAAARRMNIQDETVFLKLLSPQQAEKKEDYWELAYLMPDSVPQLLQGKVLTLNS